MSGFEEISARVRRQRELRGLTQDEAAGRAGVSVRTWGRWEAGESRGFLRALGRIADVLGTSGDELVGDAPAVAIVESEPAGRAERVEVVVERDGDGWRASVGAPEAEEYAVVRAGTPDAALRAIASYVAYTVGPPDPLSEPMPPMGTARR